MTKMQEALYYLGNCVQRLKWVEEGKHLAGDDVIVLVKYARKYLNDIENISKSNVVALSEVEKSCAHKPIVVRGVVRCQVCNKLIKDWK